MLDPVNFDPSPIFIPAEALVFSPLEDSKADLVGIESTG
jgi:hypothetical protein